MHRKTRIDESLSGIDSLQKAQSGQNTQIAAAISKLEVTTQGVVIPRVEPRPVVQPQESKQS